MKGFSEIQQDVQNELGDRVVEVVFEGLRSEKIIEEIRRTGTLSRDSIKGGDLISVPEEWNRAGVYADLGEKGREMRRRSELYVGSAAALKAHYEAGLGPLVGLANRVFNGHERFSFRQQYPKNLHYKRGYTKDVPHTYICLWTLPDVAIAGHIGYPTVPSKGEEGYQVYREKRQALITLVEAILIRLLGCHYYKEFDRMAEEQHGFQKCKLVPFPLNRAFALEKCGGAWFTTETGRAAGQKGHGVLKGRWIEELGLEKGADISISQVLRKRKGDQVRGFNPTLLTLVYHRPRQESCQGHPRRQSPEDQNRDDRFGFQESRSEQGRSCPDQISPHYRGREGITHTWHAYGADS